VVTAFGLSAAAADADNCPNAAVRDQQGATALPDCRAYEVVNPTTDDIGDVNRVPTISDDGNIASYMSVVPGNDAQGGAIASTSLARRTATGWTSVSADLTSSGAIYLQTASTVPLAFSSDFSRVLMTSSLPATPTDVNNGRDAYLVDVGRSTARLMSQGFNTPPERVIGATADLSRVVLRHTGSAPVPGLYASDGSSLELLSIYPDGTPLSGSQDVPAGGAYQRGLGVGENRNAVTWVERGGSHAVSDDARRVYFYDNVTSESGYLYLRDHNRTVGVSVSARTGDVGSMHRAYFISANHDGSSAFFASVDQLTDAATPGGGIYRFDLATQSVTQITPDAGDPSGFIATGAIASDDQSHLYFTSTAALMGSAQAGDTNAYVWTSGGGVRFLAKVGAGDKFLRVTPDGRYALMLSTASIDGAPNNNFQALYRFDDTTRQIACVSCRPDGSPSHGSADIDSQSYGFPSSPITHNRSLTFDGDVAFTSTDQIVPADQTSAQDVYLYNKGRVALLTAGRGDTDSYVGDISDDGRNVFVVTRAALIGADRDREEFDVYDVRVGGGFLEPPPPPGPCRGDDCQGPGALASTIPAPSSPRVTGAGNPPLTAATKRLSVSRLTTFQRATLARTGKVSITARVTGSGTLTLRGRGRIAGKSATMGSGRKVVLEEARTSVKVTFQLSSAARRELSRRHRVSVTLEARLSGLSKGVTTTANLTRGHR
jgi:hypothetical protein